LIKNNTLENFSIEIPPRGEKYIESKPTQWMKIKEYFKGPGV
jgi:hypothetical protein